MIRKFECKDCKNTFDADDREYVFCPQCHSDNVDYYKYQLPRWILWSVVGSIMAILLIMWYYHTPDNSSDSEGFPGNNPIIEPITNDTIPKYQRDVSYIAPSLSIAKKDYNAANETYNCRITTSNPPKQAWKMVIKTKGGKLVAESENGQFDKLPYSTDDGIYIVVLVDKVTGNLLCEEREFPDFPKLDVVKNPWSESDLQMALNNETSLVDNPNIANPHKVIVINKPKGDNTPTNSLRDVQLTLQQCTITAKVNKVEHDKMNKICTAEIIINYPADWMSEDDEY